MDRMSAIWHSLQCPPLNLSKDVYEGASPRSIDLCEMNGRPMVKGMTERDELFVAVSTKVNVRGSGHTRDREGATIFFQKRTMEGTTSWKVFCNADDEMGVIPFLAGVVSNHSMDELRKLELDIDKVDAFLRTSVPVSLEASWKNYKISISPIGR
jgi:hypothetical protein